MKDVRGRKLVGLCLSTATALAIVRLSSGSWTAAVLFVVLLFAVVVPFSRVRDRRQKQAHGLPQNTPTEAAREVRITVSPELAVDQAVDALRRLDFVKPSSVRTDRTKRVIRARTRISRDSFGERLTVRVGPAAGGANVRVESRGVVPQLIDYGKNARNVATVMARLQNAALD
jgi:uncharacterized protein (DUF58 family)